MYCGIHLYIVRYKASLVSETTQQQQQQQQASGCRVCDLYVCSMDDAHPVRPDFRRRTVRQVVEVGVNVAPAEYVRQLLGRTREAAVAADLVQSVAVGLRVASVVHQVALAQAPSLKHTPHTGCRNVDRHRLRLRTRAETMPRTVDGD